MNIYSDYFYAIDDELSSVEDCVVAVIESEGSKGATVSECVSAMRSMTKDINIGFEHERELMVLLSEVKSDEYFTNKWRELNIQL